MMLWFKNNSAWFLIPTIFVFLFLSCTGEQDVAFVDFSDRIIVERPGDGTGELLPELPVDNDDDLEGGAPTPVNHSVLPIVSM